MSVASRNDKQRAFMDVDMRCDPAAIAQHGYAKGIESRSARSMLLAFGASRKHASPNKL